MVLGNREERRHIVGERAHHEVVSESGASYREYPEGYFVLLYLVPERHPFTDAIGVIKTRCLQCGAEIEPGWDFCIKCGKKMEGFICPKCGNQMPGDAQFCFYCGEKKNEGTSSAQQAQPVPDPSEQPKEIVSSPHPEPIDEQWSPPKAKTNSWSLGRIIGVLAVAVVLFGFFTAGGLFNAMGLYFPAGFFAMLNSGAFPDNADAQYNMGVAQLHLDSSEASINGVNRYFQKAVKMNPSPRFKQQIAEACLDAADAYRASDQTISAYRALQLAVNYYQSDVDPNFGPRLSRLQQRISLGI